MKTSLLSGFSSDFIVIIPSGNLLVTIKINSSARSEGFVNHSAVVRTSLVPLK